MFTRFFLLVALSLACFGLRAELVFHVTGQANEVRAVFSGDITPADVDSAKVMAGLLKSGRQTLAGNTVWLAGDGGDFDASMRLGRMLRELGVYTAIAKNDRCLSACVFAFMGGERRSVEGKLGIHRPYFPVTQDFPDRQGRFRNLQKTLRAYIEELDFPDSLYEAVMAVPPESMNFLAPAELKRFYLVGISPSSEDVADAASARRLGLTMHDYLQQKAKTIAEGVSSSCNNSLSGNVACSSAVGPAK